MERVSKIKIISAVLVVAMVLTFLFCVPSGIVNADEGKITVVPIIKDGRVTYRIDNLNDLQEKDVFVKIEVTTDETIKIFGGNVKYFTKGEVKENYKDLVVFNSAVLDLPANGIAIGLIIASIAVFIIMVVASFIAFGDKEKRKAKRQARIEKRAK